MSVSGSVPEKACATCSEIKPPSEFGRKKSSLDGLQYNCRPCDRAAARTWPSNSRENRQKIEQRYKERHPGRRSEILRRCRLKDPERNRQWNRQSHLRNKQNPDARLASALRRRLLIALKHDQKAGSAVRDLGCSIAELRAYLESKFQPGMTWGNHGRTGWHIDHIRPLSAFDLADREQFLTACHYTNLQPLWARDNLKKGALSD